MTNITDGDISLIRVPELARALIAIIKRACEFDCCLSCTIGCDINVLCTCRKRTPVVYCINYWYSMREAVVILQICNSNDYWMLTDLSGATSTKRNKRSSPIHLETFPSYHQNRPINFKRLAHCAILHAQRTNIGSFTYNTLPRHVTLSQPKTLRRARQHTLLTKLP
jgi:hypothetical protein